MGIAQTFGELLSTDPITTSKCHIYFAYICIGVSEGTYMPAIVDLHSKLGVHTQKLIYETIPFACFLCLKAGHKAHQCPSVEKRKPTKSDSSSKEKKKSIPSHTSGKGRKKKLLWRHKPTNPPEARVSKEEVTKQNDNKEEALSESRKSLEEDTK